MKNQKKKESGFRKWLPLALLLLLYLIMFIYSGSMGRQATVTASGHLIQMLQFIPPIFVILGLLDVWVEKETVIRLMGDKSGFTGILLAFFIGSAAAGPLYAAFPIALMMLRKGCSIYNVFIFLGAWSTTKIPMLTFETASMGTAFAMTRLACSIVGIVMIAAVVSRSLNEEEKALLYEKAEKG